MTAKPADVPPTSSAHGSPAAGSDRLFKSTGVVASFTFLSRITGLARDISFSTWFGAGR